ncbi:folate-binding protein [Roseobacter sp. YSTF-M11]|uniref:Folate-binding protein n=1 Tax=Roseobacter insulae TaxID=2859783 RepID=A0A9X1K1N8_9RHOB|nr:folate-binding protein [Roseobacter insulae]MBW4707698.1 folate-binding protein [Roseobacter insulae]
MTKRRILQLSGSDARDFLQGLITNDIAGIDTGLVYAAILTPQGKYIADFFLSAAPDGIYLDVDDSLADMLVQRLTMYKLRADVTIAPTNLHLHRGLGPVPEDGFADPRHDALGWRAYRDSAQTDDTTDWTAVRVAHLIPETGIELTPDTFILEVGFERLSGVDFRKGCYVGQEVTARMKHKTELRKGLAKVAVSGPAETGSDITANGKPAGTLLSRTEDTAIAYLRFDRAKGDLQAGEATVTRLDP